MESVKSKNTDNLIHKSTMEKKISIIHIIYLSIIFLIIHIFLLLIIPGKINNEAFTNFSFAATIASIILAVITIIYSFYAGASTTNQLNNIKTIENNIGYEIKKLSAIEENIQSAATKINQVDETTKATKEALNNIFEALSIKDNPNNSNKSYSTLTTLLLYICCYSKKSQKPIPEDLLDSFLKGMYRVCHGFILCAENFCPELLSAQQNKITQLYTISKYDEKTLPPIDRLKTSLEGIKNEKTKKYVEIFITKLNNYFENK